MEKIDEVAHKLQQFPSRAACWWRALVACALVFALIVQQPAAVACGPFFAQTIFSFRVHPDFPLMRFAAGDLGIVQPTYARSYLVVAYRYMSGMSLNKTEQASVAGLWARRFAHFLFADDAHPDPASEWLHARRKCIGGKDAPYIEQHRKASGGTFPAESYFYFQNCQEDALRTAARTVSQRAKEFGPNSDSLKSWVAAQDIVFTYCGNRSEKVQTKLPQLLPNSAPALLKADRAYQVAAIHFYAADFATAEKEFTAIAQDRSSPWHVTAGLLVARCRIRKATLQDTDAQADVDMRAAEEQLNNVLKNPEYHEIYPAAQRLLGFIAYRLRPEERYEELSVQLSTRAHVANLGDAIGDYTLLLDKPLGDTDDVDTDQRQKVLDNGYGKLRRERERNDLTDWIVTFQSSSPAAREHALAQWKETKSVPWLFAALSKTTETSPEADALIEGSGAVKASNPAYAGIAFHRGRLLAEAGRGDQARAEIDELLAPAGKALPRSTTNLLLALRMTLAKNLDEWLKYSIRVPSLVTTDESGEETLSEFYLVDMRTKSEVTRWSENRSEAAQFDSDAAIALTEKVPLAVLVSAAQKETLPEPVRRNLGQTVWVKAFLLNRRDVALQLVPMMKQFFPQRTAELEAYVAATSIEEQRFAGSLSILKSPGWHPYVEQGAGRETTDFTKIDNYKNNWWCSWDKPKEEEWGYYNYNGRESMSAPLHMLYPNGIVESPEFLDKNSREQAMQEWKEIQATKTSIEALAEPVLEWAKSHSKDGRVPEALHYVVRAYRYGCDEPSVNYSKIAFKLLHKRHPNNEWTGKTPFWF
jgi:hypothetical protein